MFCTQCGKQNPEGNRFCAGCGATLTLNITPPKSAQLSLKSFVLIFGGSSILVLIVVLIALLRGGGDTTVKPPQPTQSQQPSPPKVAELIPVLQVNPLSLEFSLREGEKAPPAQRVTIANTGKGRLEWQARTDAPWLRLNRNSGVLTEGKSAQLTVSIDTDRLQTIIKQEAQIVVTVPKANGNPITIKVVMNLRQNVNQPPRVSVEIPINLLDHVGVENIDHEQVTLGSLFRRFAGKYVVILPVDQAYMCSNTRYTLERYQSLADLLTSRNVELVFLESKNYLRACLDDASEKLGQKLHSGSYLFLLNNARAMYWTYVDSTGTTVKVIAGKRHTSVDDLYQWAQQMLADNRANASADGLDEIEALRKRLEHLFSEKTSTSLKPLFPTFDNRLRFLYLILSRESLEGEAFLALVEEIRYSDKIRQLRNDIRTSNEFDRRSLQVQLENLLSRIRRWVDQELARTVISINEDRHYWARAHAWLGEYDFAFNGFPILRWSWDDGPFSSIALVFDVGFPTFLPADEETARKLILNPNRQVEAWTVWKPVNTRVINIYNTLQGREVGKMAIVGKLLDIWAFDKSVGFLKRLVGD